jgi:hypothetical protein
MRKLLSPPSLVLKYGGQALSHSRGLTLSRCHIRFLSVRYPVQKHRFYFTAVDKACTAFKTYHLNILRICIHSNYVI